MRKLSVSLAVATILFTASAQEDIRFKTKFDDAVPVLNVGTFHMGYTSDANKTEFDEHNKENVRQIHEIAKAMAAFKPTVIIVETTPEYQEKLETLYKEYLKNPKMTFQNPDEIELLAYEIGRLSETKRMYGIDYKEGYNYAIYYQLKQKVDSTTYPRYGEMMDANEAQFDEENASVLELLKMTNHPDYLDYLINVNADMLTYVSTKGKAEGAEQATKFYHRNLVMFSNLNQIELKKEDRVFILMGATHTAFFNEWIKRSPKYKLVNVFDYLK